LKHALSKFSSDPSTVTVGITPPSQSSTITGSTGNFQFQVCTQNGVGTVTVKSLITDWSPQDKFDRAAAADDTAQLTINN